MAVGWLPGGCESVRTAAALYRTRRNALRVRDRIRFRLVRFERILLLILRRLALPPPAQLSQCELDHNDDPFYGECDCRLSWWLDFFDGIGQPVVFASSTANSPWSGDSKESRVSKVIDAEVPSQPTSSWMEARVQQWKWIG